MSGHLIGELATTTRRWTPLAVTRLVVMSVLLVPLTFYIAQASRLQIISTFLALGLSAGSAAWAATVVVAVLEVACGWVVARSAGVRAPFPDVLAVALVVASGYLLALSLVSGSQDLSATKVIVGVALTVGAYSVGGLLATLTAARADQPRGHRPL